jgi:hypothetical protein
LRIYNNFILTLAVVSAAVNSFLALQDNRDIVSYFIVNTVAFLVVTLLYVQFNPRARAALNSISFMLFGGFMLVIALKIVEVVAGK